MKKYLDYLYEDKLLFSYAKIKIAFFLKKYFMIKNVANYFNNLFRRKDSYNAEKKEYAVVLVKNKKISKIIQNYKKFGFAKTMFEKLKDENYAVFPERFKAADGISKSSLEVLLIKKKVSDTGFRKIFTGMGVIEERVVGDWDIVDKFFFEIEETFKVYGYEQRMTAVDILANIFIDKIKNGESYDVYAFNNKLVITNDVDVIVILCKSVYDAERLHDFFLKYFLDKKIGLFIFRGSLKNGKRKRELYNFIEKKLGIPKTWMYRHTVKP